MMNTILKKELVTYEKNKSDLVTKHSKQHVLIKDDNIVDVFQTESDAVRQGYKRFGNVPFLVKQILEVEVAKNFTSNLINV